MPNESKKSENALREEKILEFWRENKIFSKTLSQSKGKKEFVFYEGPPTANGKPGIHHLEARAFKDAIPRYKTMRGYHVRRKGGWDTHGLPVELQVEKVLGLNSKKAIEEYGIGKFNQECKASVWEYTDLWRKFTERMGYWVDQENPYVTYHNKYIESVWNVIKKVDEQGLLYKDYKVVPWCPRCGTALSSHELAQGYENVKDLSITAKFKVKGQDDTYILAWTTTPWTLPGNVALAVGENITYVKAKIGGEILILAKERLSILENSEILEELGGSALIGLEYEPLYSYLKDRNITGGENGWKIYGADFVTTEDGTGIVHTAVMYGQDDFVLGTKVGLPKFHLVDETGHFIVGTGFLEGRFVKDEEVAVDIIKDLARRGLLFKKEKYEHSYPHCWRCKTPLIYYARDSWYIRMSDPKIKRNLIAENKKIAWEPEHIQEGRFGEWLREVKDWAISRERYWGTPLPAWNCDTCKKTCILGSISDVVSRIKGSGNQYFVMRHGQTEVNLKNLVDTTIGGKSHLTGEGIAQTKQKGEMLKNKNIDFVFTSPYNRALETAEVLKEVIGLREEQIIVDNRLGEMAIPSFEGKTWMEYHEDFPKDKENFDKAKGGDESYQDVKARVMSFLFEMEEKYKDKKILILTHGSPAWLIVSGAKMMDKSESLELLLNSKEFHYFDNSEVQELKFAPFPHDKLGNLDLHRPYIDEVNLLCTHSISSGQACGGSLVRTKEVMDVWLDSGAMPFAQDHYPFEKKFQGFFGKNKLSYPADFISEAIDQTRGWFYTLHAVGVLMGKGRAYKNVICLGHLLDAQGKKMSKSLGNVIDPWAMIEKYGVDTLRLWMYSVNQPGESKNFDEKTVLDLNRQVFGLLYNVLAFYELYRDENLEQGVPNSKNILDQWILSKLNELVHLSTENLEKYKLLEPVRGLRDFIGDLSTWYLRRSRERIKNGDTEAKQTLYFVLKTVAKLLAPFAPFSAEDIWQRLRSESDEDSVHLVSWPKAGKPDEKIIENMKKARELVSIGLKERQMKNIPVRQPLASLAWQGRIGREYDEIIKDELNVKEVLSDSHMNSVIIDFRITPELKEEGNYRELVRAVQDMRKEMGLQPSDVVNLVLPEENKEVAEKFDAEFKKVAGLREIKFEQGAQMRLEK